MAPPKLLTYSILVRMIVCSVLFASTLAAQVVPGPAGSAPVPGDRVVDWRRVGVVQPDGTRGIPNRTTICATVDAAQFGENFAGLTTAVQTAIDQCPRDGVVYFLKGTYRFTGPLFVDHPVVLRGAGRGETRLLPKNIILFSPYRGSAPSLTVVNWTAGYQKGSSTITLQDASALAKDEIIVLDQQNDTSLVFPVGESGSQAAYRNGSVIYGGTDRAAPQMVKITAVNGNVVTIDNPLLYTFQPSLNPQAFWWGGGSGSMQYAGIEDLTIDGSNATVADNQPLVAFHFCANCWVQRVEVMNVLRSAIAATNYSYRAEIRDNIIRDSIGPIGPTRYGIELGLSSAFLVENNVLDNIGGPLLSTLSISGGVFGYNYIPRSATNNGWLFPGISNHFCHTNKNLIEGNVSPSIVLDNIWGSGSHQTLYRNHFTGGVYDGSPYNNNRYPVIIQAHQRYTSLLGNILGTPGGQTWYEVTRSSIAPDDRAVYIIGYWSNPWNDPTFVLYDDAALTTLYRHGNWDSYTAARAGSDGVVWDPAVAARVLPPSLYHETKPEWFGDLPWPPIGPDRVGRVTDLPAQHCFARGLLPNCLRSSNSSPASPQTLRILSP